MHSAQLRRPHSRPSALKWLVRQLLGDGASKNEAEPRAVDLPRGDQHVRGVRHRGGKGRFVAVQVQAPVALTGLRVERGCSAHNVLVNLPGLHRARLVF